MREPMYKQEAPRALALTTAARASRTTSGRAREAAPAQSVAAQLDRQHASPSSRWSRPLGDRSPPRPHFREALLEQLWPPPQARPSARRCGAPTVPQRCGVYTQWRTNATKNKCECVAHNNAHVRSVTMIQTNARFVVHRPRRWTAPKFKV